MTESKAHLLLKEQGTKILLNNGFKKEEIFEEYRIKLSGNRFCIIDIIGIKKDLKIGIECGDLTEQNRLKILNKFCDKIIHLPYLRKKGRRGFTISIYLNNNDYLNYIKHKKRINNLVRETFKKELSK